MRYVFLAILLSFIINSLAFSQENKVKVKLELKDLANEKLIPKSGIVIFEIDRALRLARPSDDGIYLFDLLPNKKYKITFDKAGYVIAELQFNTNLPEGTSLAKSPLLNFTAYGVKGSEAESYKKEKVFVSFSDNIKNFQIQEPGSKIFKSTSENLSPLQLIGDNGVQTAPDVKTKIEPQIPAEVPKIVEKKVKVQKSDSTFWSKVSDVKDSIKSVTKNIIEKIKNQSVADGSEAKQSSEIVYEAMSTKVDSIMDIKENVEAINTIEPKELEIKNTYKSLEKRRESIVMARQLLEEAKLNCKTKEDSLQVQVRELKINEEEGDILIVEQQLENAKKQLLLQEAQINGQKIVIYSSLVLLLILFVSLIFVFIQFKAKKKAFALLERQHAEIQQKNEEITAQRDEIEAQRNLLGEQKTTIEAILVSLTDSINYAERIQIAMLPDNQVLNNVFKENFILDKPRDVVSGDFYYFKQIEDYFVIAVADCTGHGVPGAFMSMLGIAFLNELVDKYSDTSKIQTSEIVNHLREKIIRSLKQSGNEGEQQDGMDIAICTIDLKATTIEFSGANNALYLIRGKQSFSEVEFANQVPNFQVLEAQDSVLIEIKPDKMPVGIYTRMENFNSQKFNILKNDRLYLFSDGFSDQHGGASGRKIKSRKFKELLLESHSLRMNQQMEFLENFINDWKKHLDSFDNKPFEQTDDICVIGIQV